MICGDPDPRCLPGISGINPKGIPDCEKIQPKETNHRKRPHRDKGKTGDEAGAADRGNQNCQGQGP